MATSEAGAVVDWESEIEQFGRRVRRLSLDDSHQKTFRKSARVGRRDRHLSSLASGREGTSGGVGSPRTKNSEREDKLKAIHNAWIPLTVPADAPAHLQKGLVMNTVTLQVRTGGPSGQPLRLGKTPGSLSFAELRALRGALGSREEQLLRYPADRGVNSLEDDDDDTETSLRAILYTLEGIGRELEGILRHSQHLGGDTVQLVRGLRNDVSNLCLGIQQDDTALDDRTDVEALVDMKKLPWNFENRFDVDYYRRSVSQIERPEPYRDWHIPSYPSQKPLPPGLDRFEITVVLPSEIESEKIERKGLISVERGVIVLAVEAKDSVEEIIQTVAKKCRDAGWSGKAHEYCLKAQGLSEYMACGPQPLLDFTYVRYRLRDGFEVRLTLQRLPFKVIDDKHKELREAYEAKVDPDIETLDAEDHRGLTTRMANWRQLEEIGRFPMSEMNVPYQLQIIGLEEIAEAGLPRLSQLDEATTSLVVETFLFNGCRRLPGTTVLTQPQPLMGSCSRWGQWCRLGMPMNLPRTARLGVIVWAETEGAKGRLMLAWVVKPLVDELGVLASGPQALRLWGVAADKKSKHKKRDITPDFLYRATTCQNLSNERCAVLQVRFDDFSAPVVAPITDQYRPPNAQVVGFEIPREKFSKVEQERLERLAKVDPLAEITEEDLRLFWRARHSFVSQPNILWLFLLSVDWGNKEYRFEAYRLLDLWQKPKTLSAWMLLLDAKYQDYTVRQYAVEQLKVLSDEELQLYLLQLTQCLKFESYHDSPLKRFLVDRALRSPHQVGHHFFWHLKAELHDPMFCERFGLVLEEYLSQAGRYAAELRKQERAVKKLEKVSSLIQKLKREEGYNDEDAMVEYHREIDRLNRDFFAPMRQFPIPLDPRWEAKMLIKEKCRYMSSKMVPLWLVFQNADPQAARPINVIFKSGDDLRQDILTLQLLTLMDRLWLANGLDLKMKPYKVIATGVNENGDGVGMIEVVTDSDTTSNIQIKYGGGALGALRLEPIDMFLRDNNKGEAYNRAVDNFICSCAGYCVATFVLGIGDRHNGNIMVTKDGHLFHIDFGHFLGNFKKKFGVNRERAAFVFTPEMAYVMGGRRYQKSALFQKFLHLCSRAFRTLRENADTLENMFTLMVAAGMPELMHETDILYMRNKLNLDMSWQEADNILLAEIQKSLATTYRRVDNLIHNMRHG